MTTDDKSRTKPESKRAPRVPDEALTKAARPNIHAEAVTSIGKHLLLEVPDFSQSYFPPDSALKKMSSFLRLGAPGDFKAQKGWDLLERLTQAGPPGDPRLDKLESDAGADETVFGNRDAVFIDDVRDRPPGDGHDMTKAARQDESTKLFSRGGWRDHSDGNRISTTYGDKVEVVRGNYKMVVLGRQDDPGQAMGWDVAGSHIQDFAPGTMPGASVYVEYVKDYFEGDGESGVWLLVNSTENVWEFARNAGNFREQKWGDLHESYTGSENPKKVSTSESDGTRGHPGDEDLPYGSKDKGSRPPWAATGIGIVRSNPHIIEKTWATKIEGYTGSESLRIPEIKEETWAETVNELSDVSKSVTSNTLIGGAQTEATTVGGAVTSTTTVGGAVTELTTIGAAHIALNTTVGVEFENNLAAVKIGLDNAAVILEEAACVFHLELEAGTKLSVALAPGIEINLAPKLALCVADDLEVSLVKVIKARLAKKEEIAAEIETTAVDLKLTATTTLTLTGGNISANAGASFTVTATQINLG
jgi:hypothetical protein